MFYIPWKGTTANWQGSWKRWRYIVTASSPGRFRWQWTVGAPRAQTGKRIPHGCHAQQPGEVGTDPASSTERGLFCHPQSCRGLRGRKRHRDCNPPHPDTDDSKGNRCHTNERYRHGISGTGNRKRKSQTGRLPCSNSRNSHRRKFSRWCPNRKPTVSPCAPTFCTMPCCSPRSAWNGG